MANRFKKSRQKGTAEERTLVRYLQERGRAAERVPLSGAAGGKFSGDVSVPVLGQDRLLEVKVRANGFRQLYDWLGDENYAVVVRADRRKPLLVIPLDRAIDVLDVAEKRRVES